MLAKCIVSIQLVLDKQDNRSQERGRGILKKKMLVCMVLTSYWRSEADEGRGLSYYVRPGIIPKESESWGGATTRSPRGRINNIGNQVLSRASFSPSLSQHKIQVIIGESNKKTLVIEAETAWHDTTHCSAV